VGRKVRTSRSFMSPLSALPPKPISIAVFRPMFAPSLSSLIKRFHVVGLVASPWLHTERFYASRWFGAVWGLGRFAISALSIWLRLPPMSVVFRESS
jgi:hypothetical protein